MLPKSLRIQRVYASTGLPGVHVGLVSPMPTAANDNGNGCIHVFSLVLIEIEADPKFLIWRRQRGLTHTPFLTAIRRLTLHAGQVFLLLMVLDDRLSMTATTSGRGPATLR